MMKKLSLIVLALGLIGSACKKEKTATAAKTGLGKTVTITFAVPTYQFNDIPTAPALTFPLSGKFNVNAKSNNTTTPLKYSSSDTNVATIDGNGEVIMLKAGDASITVTQAAVEGSYKAATKTIPLKVPKAEIVTQANKITYGGGYIYHVTDKGIHGYIVSKENTTFMSWTEGYAFCNAYSSNGFSGWSLPKLAQLQLLFGKQAEIGNITSDALWSSTAYGTDAYFMNLSGGSQQPIAKTFKLGVRAVKSF